MRVLMICPELPRPGQPGTMAPGMRQIQSIQALGIETVVVDMQGIPKLKYLQLLPKIRRYAKQVDVIHSCRTMACVSGSAASAQSASRLLVT